MKLFFSHTSPYSRKVRLVIIEKGLDEQVKGVLVNPADAPPELHAANPLGQIPTLLLDDGEALFDSPVICRYLDSLAAQSPLIPRAGWRQWKVLRWEALADGITDVAYNLVMERRRPASEQSASWIAHWSASIGHVLANMEQKVDELGSEMTLAHLTVGSAVGYVDFRCPELLYGAECPQVAAYPQLLAWYEAFKTRHSMMATRPFV